MRNYPFFSNSPLISIIVMTSHGWVLSHFVPLLQFCPPSPPSILIVDFNISLCFSIVTSDRGYLIQAGNHRDLQDWLYSINPLLAGQIKSKTARSKPTVAQMATSNGEATTPLASGAPGVPLAAADEWGWRSLKWSTSIQHFFVGSSTDWAH